MKKSKLFIILALVLLSLAVMVACNGGTEESTTEAGTGNETGTTAGTGENGTTDGTTDGTTAGTTADTEAETQMPRYDYFEAEVGPNVTLDKSVYASMNLKLSPDLLITDEQVQSYLQYLIFQERVATNGETKVYDQALKLGDTAYIYYKGTVDGEEFEGGSNMDDKTPYGLGLGSGSFIPGFEDGLVGVIPNQTSKDKPAEVHVTFPEGYNDKLGGKDAIFYVVVEYAVQYTLPEYNREFVEKELGYKSEKVHVTDQSFLDEFEDEYLPSYLQEQNKEQVEAAKTDALWTYLTEVAVCKNLPQLELDYYKTAYKNELQSAYDYYKTQGGEQFTKVYPTINEFASYYMGFEEGSDWEEEINKMAERMVKKDMIVHAIAEWENMETVTEEELEEEIQYWIDYYASGYYQVTKEDILENIGEAYLRESAFAVKMYDYLMGNCTFEYAE